MEITKTDWKLFRERLPEWQERYMEKLEKEYIEYLESDEAASTKWWGLRKKIHDDYNCPGVRLDLIKRNVDSDLVRLIMWRVITEDDIDGFSDELIDIVKNNVDCLNKSESQIRSMLDEKSK